MLFRVFTIMKVQATIGQNKEMQKRSNSLAKETTSWSMFVTLGRATQKLVLIIIRREARNIICNPMFLHTTSIAIEKHVIHLFLIVYLQIFLLSGEPCLEVLQLLPQLDNFFFNILILGRHDRLFLNQLASFSIRCLILLFSISQETDTFFSQLLGNNSLTLRHLQDGEENFIPVHDMGNACLHGFGCF